AKSVHRLHPSSFSKSSRIGWQPTAAPGRRARASGVGCCRPERVAGQRRKSNRCAALPFDPGARARSARPSWRALFQRLNINYSATLGGLRPPAPEGDSRLTAFGRCESSPPACFNRHGSCPSFRERIFCKAVAVCVATLAAVALAGAREFRVADTQSEDYPTVQALMFMARLGEERTGGPPHIRLVHSPQPRREQ